MSHDRAGHNHLDVARVLHVLAVAADHGRTDSRAACPDSFPPIVARCWGRFLNPQFDTKHSELGELVFRLKNRNDKNTLDSIADTAVQFIQGWNPSFDVIVPVLPSRKRVPYQPVVEIATAIGARLSNPVNTTAVSKIRDTPELKDVFDYQERMKLLQGAFNVDRDTVRDKRILLVDDLYRSGATATILAQGLLAGGAAAVYMLAMTKTRTRT